MSAGKVGAIAVGVAGIILVSVSGIGLAANSKGHCQWQDSPDANSTTVQPTVIHTTENTSNTTITTTSTSLIIREWHCTCTPFTHAELTMSLLALIGGSLMWAISSGM